MKVFSIFYKNLKSVARSWPYFLILFLMPVVLILVAGAVLNSADFDNIRVGMIGSSDLDVSEISNIRNYDSLSSCLFDLTNSKTTICISSVSGSEGKNLDIYLDNSNRIVSFYTRQFIMANLLDLQSGVLEQTSTEVSEKVALYSTSISDARVDLVEAREELGEQERLLQGYRNNLTDIRKDFDEVYYPLKELEPEINEISSDLHSLRENISESRDKLNDIRQRLEDVSGFLFPRLGASDYNFVVSILGDIYPDLDSIDDSLAMMQSTGSDQRLIMMADNFSLIIQQLDTIKLTLDNLDNDLSDSIIRTRESKNKIDSFIRELDNASSDLNKIKDQVGEGQFSFQLREVFDFPDDPVLLAFPLLIALIITFTSLVLSNMFILREVNQRSYLRETISPTWDINFLFADYLINLFFVAIQAAVLFLVGTQLFSLPVSEISVFALVIFLTASIFIFVGMSIGYLIKHQSLSMLLTIFLLMVLIVLSDILAPSILAGDIAKFFIDLNPFMILKNILWDRIVLDKGFRDVFVSISRLGVFFIVSFVVAYLAKKFSKEDI